jgi:hypothetical protein
MEEWHPAGGAAARGAADTPLDRVEGRMAEEERTASAEDVQAGAEPFSVVPADEAEGFPVAQGAWVPGPRPGDVDLGLPHRPGDAPRAAGRRIPPVRVVPPFDPFSIPGEAAS